MNIQEALKNYQVKFVAHMEAMKHELESSLDVKRTRSALRDAKNQLVMVEHNTLEDIERQATEKQK